MNTTAKKLFLFLIITQMIHSLEEYFFSLWEVFAPARIASEFLSDDVEIGFIAINLTLVMFGIWAYLFPIRRSASNWRGLVWFWVLLEFGNGAGHIWLAWASRGYFPGVYTAPFLLLFSIALGYDVIRNSRREGLSA